MTHSDVISLIILICITCYVGAGAKGNMFEMLWRRRKTRRQTEKTSINLRYLEKPVYSTQ